MLPMGTIMAVCMPIGVTALALTLVGPLASGGRARRTDDVSHETKRDTDGTARHRAPHPLLRAAGVVVLLAGLWNALWHAPRHLGQFWGQAALGSGLVMLLAATCLLAPTRLPSWSRPLVLVALLGFALLYGVTLYRL